MKRIALAAALTVCAGAAFAQQPASEVPPHKCGASPEYPGRLVLTSDMRRKAWDRDIKAYSECMKTYVEDRKKTADANMAAGNTAIEEYNAAIKKIREEEAAANAK